MGQRRVVRHPAVEQALVVGAMFLVMRQHVNEFDSVGEVALVVGLGG